MEAGSVGPEKELLLEEEEDGEEVRKKSISLLSVMEDRVETRTAMI